MYAPTENKVDAEKEKFYDDLQTVIDRTPKSDTTLVLGDANAKLRMEDVYRGVSGKHTLHEISNRNGKMLLELALGNNLTVMSTQFQHKKIHKGTSKKKELIEDVRTIRGLNIDSNHYLLKIIVNQKLPKIYYKRTRDFTGR